MKQLELFPKKEPSKENSEAVSLAVKIYLSLIDNVRLDLISNLQKDFLLGIKKQCLNHPKLLTHRQASFLLKLPRILHHFKNKEEAIKWVEFKSSRYDSNTILPIPCEKGRLEMIEGNINIWKSTRLSQEK